MQWRQGKYSWKLKAAVYSISSLISGLFCGSLLGFIGYYIFVQYRIGLAILLALLAIVLGVLEIIGILRRPLQCDVETPQRWVRLGHLNWAIRNGLALGCGATTRIGFCLWYLIPVSSFLFGKPELGAIIYGTYSLMRGTTVWLIIFLIAQKYLPNWSDWLLNQKHTARLFTASLLIIIGAFTFTSLSL